MIDAVRAGADGAVPGVAVTDTVKVVDATGVVVDTPDRGRLVAVQTPQAFRAGVLRAAHATGDDGTDDAALVERAGGRVLVVPGEATDDAALVEAAGGRVVVVPGDPANLKITTPADLERVRP